MDFYNQYDNIDLTSSTSHLDALWYIDTTVKASHNNHGSQEQGIYSNPLNFNSSSETKEKDQSFHSFTLKRHLGRNYRQ